MRHKKESKVLGAIFLALAAFSIYWSNRPPELLKPQEPIPGQVWCLNFSGEVAIQYHRYFPLILNDVGYRNIEYVVYEGQKLRRDGAILEFSLDKFLKSAHPGPCE